MFKSKVYFIKAQFLFIIRFTNADFNEIKNEYL